ncbi:hypothetical protein WOLCODRAFT_48506, partial [Wolfiporia cocos MD-104 SS10]
LDYLTANTDGIDLAATIQGCYMEDGFFSNVTTSPKQFKNFREADGLLFICEQEHNLLCIPNILAGKRAVREILIMHAHSLLAHLGAYKTLGLLRDHVWWRT